MLNVYVAASQSDLEKAFSLRAKVFIDEQNVPPELEIDEFEDEAVHFLVIDEAYNITVGAGRMRNIENIAKIERICVHKDYRNQNIGTLIMEKIEAYAKHKHFSKCMLEAQVQAIPFYEKIGYEICSTEFLDAGILHRKMEKSFVNNH